MCGIAGLYNSNRKDEALGACVSRMTATLVHRGPDGVGLFVEDGIALGHRRLSILDLTEAGAQPMQLGDNGPVITYNGEVYNFLELRRELEAKGCAFRGHSDTEVILHVYARWGLAGLKRLEGIFSLALWDSCYRRLILMRDRLGVKPLFYGESTHGLAFGSEIKAVLAAGGIEAGMDDQSLSEYLWYGNPFEHRTFYKGVRALEPGHWLVIEGNQRRIEPWWRIEEWLERPIAANNMPDAALLVRTALDQAVERQLVADVPVGIFLSGGVDSSAIAASAMQTCTQPLRSYAAGFDFGKGINELPKASRVAKHLGLDHHELRVAGGDLPAVLLTLAQAHDEPFADAANIPLYLMCRQLAGQIKVVLQGDGGDELFAGYRRYAVLRNARWWRLWPQVLSPLARAGGGLGRRFARMADSVGNRDPAMRMAYLLTVETPQDPPEALFLPDRRREFAETTDPFLAYRRAAERFHNHDPVQQMLLTDLTVQLPSQFLNKVDRATMAAGIEVRVPLLDERVAALVVNMPSDWKAHGTEKKVLLRESQRGRLPTDILDGPKTGFGVPYEHWLRTSLYEFSQERLLDRGFLNQFALDGLKMEQTLVKHRAGQRDKGFMLWKLLQLSLFWDRQRAVVR
jgi:asparagine synthase (glutamine-hydrolysing)